MRYILCILYVFLVCNLVLAQTTKSSMLLLKEQKAYSLALQSSKLITKGDYISANIKISEALRIFQSLNNLIEIGNMYNNLGAVYEFQNLTDSAISNYVKANTIFKTLKNQRGQAACLHNIGKNIFKQGNITEAKKYFEESIQLKEKLNDNKGVLLGYHSLATIYATMNDPISALAIKKKCLLFENKLNDSTSIAQTYTDIALLFLNQNMIDSSQYYRKLSTKITQKSDLKAIIASNYEIEALELYARQKYKEALVVFDKAILISDENNFKELLSALNLDISKTYERLEMYPEALHYYHLYANSMLEKESKQNVPGLISKTTISEKESVIDSLNRLLFKQKLKTIILISIMFILILSFIFIIRIQKYRQQVLLTKSIAEQEKLRFKAIIETQDVERKRIAGDLHDSLGYMLSTVKLNLSALDDYISKEKTEQYNIYTGAINLVDQACVEVRAISHNLMPGSLRRLGLVAGIRDMCKIIEDGKSIHVELDIIGLDNRLSETIEFNLYRIIQELLNNTIKHAEATEISINLEKNNNEITLTFFDNGKGIIKELLSEGIGWKGIYSRASLLNAHVNIATEPNKGMKVTIELIS